MARSWSISFSSDFLVEVRDIADLLGRHRRWWYAPWPASATARAACLSSKSGGSAVSAFHAVNDLRKISSLEAPLAARVGSLAEATEWILRDLHNFSYEADLRTETQAVR